MVKSRSIKTMLFSLASLLISVILFYLVIYINKPVTLVVDGIEISTYVIENTTRDVLKENSIVLQDEVGVYPSKLSNIEYGDNDVFNNPVPVILYLGNSDPYEVMTMSKTIEDFLKERDIDIDENDIVEPSLYSDIIPDEEIFIKYVDIRINEESIAIPYDTEIRYNNSLYSDENRVIQEGRDGLRLIKREKRYENNIEVSDNVIYDDVERQPINKVIEKGTKDRSIIKDENQALSNIINNSYLNGGKITFLGEEYSIKYSKLVESTAFYNSGSNGNHITATGNPTLYNPDGWSTIAVDPKVIPLNTKVYVEGYGFAIAHDTGGAIRGNIIDVFMPSREAAYNWGRKKGVKIYILE
ncbi:3D/G5 domain-containing protein [Candidatus Arthromitus sp. SFB-mouse-Japan]|uniref:G5 and 3D domain-containing protein n=1 Tax=Candidatus Arthromitus sp. SFB-mouse TaxID=49118 RepID=UPI00021B8194|nr:G5 and 3D domain-containing protein [Candidatus Arthromitus sp. SFB-mouse]EIA24761.1 hypothetical protein SFB1_040G6 [Candidatus Arthromitus sp. SFB-1]EIA28796.1 hypothetical protein SFB5_108G7 [Candidatus Arthromitus sp. SFB-5]EIA29213.1 3D/G5 domain protein [Candidatus Arthromitus sp. SFB-co]EIA29714.1 hypothetical protein SFBSU_009G53 [Candidatus Arthromitus sp. SFB-mouse-SU]EIA30223.1 hypothetical protein SFB4_032G1 [Candidatus Arthromitus sp. SFB-4]